MSQKTILNNDLDDDEPTLSDLNLNELNSVQCIFSSIENKENKVQLKKKIVSKQSKSKSKGFDWAVWKGNTKINLLNKSVQKADGLKKMKNADLIKEENKKLGNTDFVDDTLKFSSQTAESSNLKNSVSLNLKKNFINQSLNMAATTSAAAIISQSLNKSTCSIEKQNNSQFEDETKNNAISSNTLQNLNLSQENEENNLINEKTDNLQGNFIDSTSHFFSEQINSLKNKTGSNTKTLNDSIEKDEKIDKEKQHIEKQQYQQHENKFKIHDYNEANGKNELKNFSSATQDIIQLNIKTNTTFNENNKTLCCEKLGFHDYSSTELKNDYDSVLEKNSQKNIVKNQNINVKNSETSIVKNNIKTDQIESNLKPTLTSSPQSKQVEIFSSTSTTEKIVLQTEKTNSDNLLNQNINKVSETNSNLCSNNLLSSNKVTQKGGPTIYKNILKFAKGLNYSKNNKIRDSLNRNTKNCIEQLLQHEQCKTNNKTKNFGEKSDVKMKFKKKILDQDYNISKSMKSVDYKDLTLMQILALKPLRSVSKLSADCINLSSRKNNKNKLNDQEDTDKMVLPEVNSNLGCKNANEDCFEKNVIYSKINNENKFFSNQFEKNINYDLSEKNFDKNSCIDNNEASHHCKKNFFENDKQESKWVQLAGHEQSFINSPNPGTILKKNKQNEYFAYKYLNETKDQIIEFLPNFHSIINENNDQFIELQDLLSLFENPCLMDIKMGCRTFLENDVSNSKARPDLYEKLIKIDHNAATQEEHKNKAITKLRYMTFRENLSSSSTLGFRIEGYKCKCNGMIKDFKYLRKIDEVKKVLKIFLPLGKDLKIQLLKKLKLLKNRFKNSDFFQNHEVIGSSLLIIYDEKKIGVWMIDFAKTVKLPQGIKINHESNWNLGNHEDGYLTGLNNLISIIKEIV